MEMAEGVSGRKEYVFSKVRKRGAGRAMALT